MHSLERKPETVFPQELLSTLEQNKNGLKNPQKASASKDQLLQKKFSREIFDFHNEAKMHKQKKEKRTARKINSEKDLDYIKYPSEQEFARFLLRHNPHLLITYEPKTFSYVGSNGQKKATLPDFLIINPKNSGKEVYVELTLAPRWELKEDEKGKRHLVDHKERQREVMEGSSPDTRYIILYKEELKKMQKKHPEFNPFILIPKVTPKFPNAL